MAKGSKTTHTVDINAKTGPGLKKAALESKKAGQGMDQASKSAGTLNRNMKGVTVQSSGASKNFSKMSQGMGGIVGAYATLAANIFAIGAAFRFLQSAGDLEKLKEGQVLYASATGTALKSLTNDIIAATDAQITFANASQSAAIGKAAGMSNDQLTALGKGAKDVSIILGRDVTDSFNRLVRGVTKAEPELLDELGIILRLADASEKYGASIGKTADQLTQYEKSQAVTVEVLDQLESKYGRIMAVMAPTGNEFTKLGKAFDDIVNQIKVFAAFVAGPIAETLTRMPFLIVGLLVSMANQLIKTGLASWATNAKGKADELAMGYQHAQAKLEDLQRAQAKRAADATGAAGRAKGLLAPDTRGKIAAPAFAQVARGEGDKLNAAQIKSMRGVLARNKTLTDGMKAQWYKVLTDIEMKNKAATKNIRYYWGQLHGGLGVLRSKLVAGWAGTMAAIKGAAAATGAFVSKALGIVSVISMVATLAISAFQWFKNAKKSQKATEDMVDEMDIATEKVKSLNEEFEKFNAVQRIITEDGQGFLQFFEAMGNRIGQLSMSMQETMFEGVREGFGEMMAETDEMQEAMMDRLAKKSSAAIPSLEFTGRGFGELEEMRDKADQLLTTLSQGGKTYNEFIGLTDQWWDVPGNLALIFGGTQHPGGFLDNWIQDTGREWSDMWKQYEVGSDEWKDLVADQQELVNGLNDTLKSADLARAAYGGDLLAFMESGMAGEDFTEFGKYLQSQLEATEIASAAFGDAKNPVTEYLSVLNELTALTPEDVGTDAWDKLIERLMAAQQESVAFSTAIANAGRMAKDNIQETNKVLMDLQKRSTEGKLADTLRLEQDERTKAADEGYGGAPSGMHGQDLDIWIARGQEIERHIILMDHLDQMKDDAKKRDLKASLEEKKALLGTTKLIGKRVKLEMQQLKNKNKIADVDDEILAIQMKIRDTGKVEAQQLRALENAYLQKDILAAQNEELERQLDYTMQIKDAAAQAFESGLQKTFAAFMKGEESSFKDAMRSLFEGIWNSVADTVANQLTEMVMGAFGFKTADQKIKEGMLEAAEEHARLIALAVAEGTGAKDRQQAEVGTATDDIYLNRYLGGESVDDVMGGIEARKAASAQKLQVEEAIARMEAEKLVRAEQRAATEEATLQRIEGYNTRRKEIEEATLLAMHHYEQAMAIRAEQALNDEVLSNMPSTDPRRALYDNSMDVPTLPGAQSDIPTLPGPDAQYRAGPVQTRIGAEVEAQKEAAWRESMTRLINANLGTNVIPADQIAPTTPIDTSWLPTPPELRSTEPGAIDLGTFTTAMQDLATNTAPLKRGDKPGSFFVHDTHVERALLQMGATGITSQSDITGVGSFGTGNAKLEGQELADLYMNKMGPKQNEKKGMFAGIIDPFKKLFTDDSPWMTKLGNYFGTEEGGFLSGLGGLFGGLGDIFGQLFGGAGGFMSIIGGMFGIPLAKGGIIKGGFRKYARGGIATSPTLGLIGEGRHNEAVVPLPDGKAIPVDMRSNAQTNNVTVNVSGDGQQTQVSGQDNEGLGIAIAKAVQEELQNQKRAGGILNRYGTA